jgi:adenosine/AMP kinase
VKETEPGESRRPRSWEEDAVDLQEVTITRPEGTNIILGQAHFIKTVEDLYEVMVNAHGAIRFGIAFCEASGPRLIRHEGNDEELRQAAITIAQEVACGHVFAIVMREGFPINVVNAVLACREVCGIFCATANPVSVVVAESASGRGVCGVIDGAPPLGVEGAPEIAERTELLRKFGYKR